MPGIYGLPPRVVHVLIFLSGTSIYQRGLTRIRGNACATFRFAVTEVMNEIALLAGVDLDQVEADARDLADDLASVPGKLAKLRLKPSCVAVASGLFTGSDESTVGVKAGEARFRRISFRGAAKRRGKRVARLIVSAVGIKAAGMRVGGVGGV
jgi:hypothetical protein